MYRNILTICLTMCICHSISAGDLDKAFKYINTGDYDKALQSIREELNKDPKDVAANYAMAKLYSSRDFKNLNLDSATIYINKAFAAVPLKADDKQTKKYLKFGVRDYTIKVLFDEVNKLAYDKAAAQNTFDSYDHFITYTHDEPLKAKAIQLRDEIKYDELVRKMDLDGLRSFLSDYPKSAKYNDANNLYEQLLYAQTTKSNTYEAFKEYLDKYPTGPYAKEAQVQYDRKLYEVYLNKNTVAGYEEFEQKYPKSPFLGEVQDKLYELSTKDHLASDYNIFIKSYPTNRNIMDAWGRLYDIYTQSATDSDYLFFQKIYPNSPLKERLQQDLYLSKLPLAPFKSNGKYGYVNTATQQMIIEPQYEDANEFSSGLAAVTFRPCTDTCYYSYIDKTGKVAFDKTFSTAFDFIRGKAVVATSYCDGNPCRFGIIDRHGEFLVRPIYEDIEPASEDLYAASSENGYGFINDAGKVIVPLIYHDAVSYSEGIAEVKKDSVWIFIDKAGQPLFPKTFTNVTSYSSGLAAVSDNDSSYGYIDHTGSWAIPAIYEFAEPFIGDTAIVSLKETNKKSKDYGLSSRYKIDRTGRVYCKLINPNAVVAKPKAKKKKKK